MQLPGEPFYLFGMGNRRKLLYKRGALYEALTGAPLYQWDVRAERIDPAEYSVHLELAGGKALTFAEDEEGVWLVEDGVRTSLTTHALSLPRFERYAQADVLRQLHHEVLINIVDGLPVPNLFVYPKPWYRDAAMMAMCLHRTGNLDLIKPWIMSLRIPFDRNNAGNLEPDNLGEALYLISLVADKSHPLVSTILGTVSRFRNRLYITGLTDGAEHPVYQTKWLKFGLRALRLDDPYEIPRVYDSYSALFWMAYTGAHVAGEPFTEHAKALYPYLGWAEAHFYHGPPPEIPVGQYPLTWEAQASEALYFKLRKFFPEYAAQQVCAPHSWHAAEMFLYLLERDSEASYGHP